MGAGKWIGGIIGFMAGPLGALAGYALGSLIELGGNTASYTTDYGNGQTEEDVFAGQRNSFLFSMLVMASYIIRADGRIMHSEMEYVRNFLRTNFGVAAVAKANGYCSTSSSNASEWTCRILSHSDRPSVIAAGR